MSNHTTPTFLQAARAKVEVLDMMGAIQGLPLFSRYVHICCVAMMDQAALWVGFDGASAWHLHSQPALATMDTATPLCFGGNGSVQMNLGRRSFSIAISAPGTLDSLTTNPLLLVELPASLQAPSALPIFNKVQSLTLLTSIANRRHRQRHEKEPRVRSPARRAH